MRKKTFDSLMNEIKKIKLLEGTKSKKRSKKKSASGKTRASAA